MADQPLVVRVVDDGLRCARSHAAPSGRISVPSATSRPGLNVAQTRRMYEKLVVPGLRGPRGGARRASSCRAGSSRSATGRSRPGRVSVLAIRSGPSAFFCVEVKPRKSCALSGIRSAPGMPARIAICFGRLGRRAPAAADEALADARDLEQPVERLEEARSSPSRCARASRYGRAGRRRSARARRRSGSLGKRMVSSSAELGLRGGA